MSGGRADLTAILSGRRLPALDGLRAISVLVVMIYHFGWEAVPGDLGVAAFFVLSGFLITWLLLKEHDAEGRISIGRFYVRRVLRIFPAYYAFLAFSFVIDSKRGDPWSPGLVAAALGYAVNYYNALFGHPTTSVAHAWSLAIEEQFYLIWPLLFALLARSGRRGLVRGLVALIAAVAAWRCALLFVLGASDAYVYNAFDTRFDNLAVGCLLAACADRPAFVRAARALSASPALPLLTGALVVVSRVAIGRGWHLGPGYTVEAILLAILIVQLLALHASRAWSWLDAPPVRFVGAISYPMYLYHQWGLGLGHHAPGPAPARFLAGLAATLLLACGSYYVVERPMLALKARFEPRR